MKVRAVKLKTVTLITLTIWSMSSFAQVETMVYVMKNGNVVFSSSVSDVDQVTFDEASPDIASIVNKNDGATIFQSPVSDMDSIVLRQVSCEYFDNPDGVVINGVRWATRNVGATGTFANSPCDYGVYYQFNKGTTDYMLYGAYYHSFYSISDSWLPVNDPSPSGWRVPTFDEIQKLTDTDYVTYEWIDNNGLTGGKFTDKATGNSIFLPAADLRNNDNNGMLLDVGFDGCYWSSTLFYVKTFACGLYFSNGAAYGQSYSYSGNGLSVRPVAKVEVEVKVTGITISPSEDVSVVVDKKTTLAATVTPADAYNKSVTWNSLNPDIATVDKQTGTVTGVSEGAATIRAIATDGSGVTADKSVVVYQPSNDMDGVVINGVRWATRNVGAPGTFVQNPEDYGEYYQFNKGTTDFLLIWYYAHSVYSYSSLWLPANDPSPANWRIPTLAEIQKLFDPDYVTCEWINNDGITGGAKFTDKATGNSIFLPAAGNLSDSGSDGALYRVGSDGFYWSSMASNTGAAYYLRFNSSSAYYNSILNNRDFGYSVRPVADVEKIEKRVTGITISPSGYVPVEVGKTTALTATLTPADAANKNVMWSSLSPDIATVDEQTGMVTGVREGVAIIRVTAADAGGLTADKSVLVYKPSSDDMNGVVINGVRWATCNVGSPGTFASSPCDQGMFYQWNRITAWPFTGNITGWDSSYPAGDAWDRANDPSPAGWRVPTYDEIQKLWDANYVSYEWINNSGLIGGKFTDKATGNSIFLPAAGFRVFDVGALSNVGSGYYWSSTALGANSAYNLEFYSNNASWRSYFRSYGLSVRSVAE
ncbi:MAG: Ig-like domain-containing protein [Candidatus Azobacteroides sp.]|nr:Ig-like domain-containing protein [Candidatus Azobacteroides sp.]